MGIEFTQEHREAIATSFAERIGITDADKVNGFIGYIENDVNLNAFGCGSLLTYPRSFICIYSCS